MRGKEKKKLLLYFLKLCYPYSFLLIEAFIFILFAILLTLPLPLLSMYIIDVILEKGDLHKLNLIGIALIISILLRASCTFLQKYFIVKFKQRILFEIRKHLYAKLQMLDLEFFKRTGSGYLVSRVHEDPSSIAGLATETILNVLTDFLIFMVGVLLVFWIHAKLAIISIVLLHLYALSVFIFNKRLRKMNREVKESYAQVEKNIQENFSGIETIKVFGAENLFLQKIANLTREALRKEGKLNLLSAFASIVATIISSIAPLLLMWYGIIEILRGFMTLGGLVAFNSFLRYLFGPVERIVNMNLGIQGAYVSLERIFELENLSPQIKEKKSAVPLKIEKGKIEFQHVTFGYDSSIKVLKGISFVIDPEDTLALVGRSGVGKSTIVNLLLRLYDVEEGRILIDNIDVRDVTINSLRKSIGIVSQDTFLFNTTIEENLKIAKPEASFDEIVEACKEANALEFIKSLPDNFKTIVGERGTKLSGGQRQRIAIARAFLKNPKILILDEATSQIDSVSERLIQDSLKKLFIKRTVIIIAHRISTVLMCKKIAFLENGEIILGSHEKLYHSLKSYREICETQMIPFSHVFHNSQLQIEPKPAKMH